MYHDCERRHAALSEWAVKVAARALVVLIGALMVAATLVCTFADLACFVRLLTCVMLA